MPTYSYACTECDTRFDAVQAFSDDALTECPKWHGRLRKLFGSVGVVFKGSGFYRTDNRDSKSSSTAAAPAKSESGSTAADSFSSSSSSWSSSSTKSAAPAAAASN